MKIQASMKFSRHTGLLGNLTLTIVSLTISVIAAEIFLRQLLLMNRTYA